MGFHGAPSSGGLEPITHCGCHLTHQLHETIRYTLLPSPSGPRPLIRGPLGPGRMTSILLGPNTESYGVWVVSSEYKLKMTQEPGHTDAMVTKSLGN